MRIGTSALLLAGLLPLAGPTSAQQVDQPARLTGDLSGFHGDTGTLIKALDRVQKLSRGEVEEIRFDDAGGTPEFRAVIAEGDQVEYMTLDDQAGILISIDERSRPVWMLNWRRSEQVHDAETATVSLAAAIATAEAEDHGAPAVAAGIAQGAADGNAGVHAYNVLVDLDGTARRVMIDDATGKVITDPQALAGWP